MKNKVQEGKIITWTNGGTAVASGDPVVIGQLPGVACVAIANAAKGAVVTEGVFTLSVKGIDGGGNSAVAVGDKLYFTAGDTPPISKKATGVPYGYALAAVSSGATTSIAVRLL